MADASIVSDSVSFFGRVKMHFTLRTIPGLDLPDFLRGARMAYPIVTQLMYSRDWVELEPLVSPAMLDAMRETMETEPFDVRQVQGADEEDAIIVTEASLSQVQVLHDDDAPWAPRLCHLDVAITSQENWRIFDFRENAALPPFDGQVRTQQSTWRFEGRVRPPLPPEEAHDEESQEASWIVHSVV